MNKLAYQGILGSNSYNAALYFSNNNNLNDYIMLEGVTSKGVVEKLVNDDVTYGVLAFDNTLAGLVLETKDALTGLNYEIIDTYLMPIHHSLFVKSKDVNIDKIASHIHAINQCTNYLKTNYPNAILEEISDTAIGAKYLSNDTFADNVGIICRKDAGLNYNLYLLADNIEDSTNNITTFHLIKYKGG